MAEVDQRNREVNVPFSYQPVSSSASVNPTDIGGGSDSSSQPSTYETMLKSSLETKKRKITIGKGTIEKAFNNNVRENMNSYIFRMFYSGGLSFYFARNPYYLKAIFYAANNNLAGYILLGYNSLRTTLLQKERANIERLLEPIKETWSEKGVSIVTDGWTDAQRRPIINFMAITESGPIFLKAVNCEGEYKDKFFIANLVLWLSSNILMCSDGGIFCDQCTNGRIALTSDEEAPCVRVCDRCMAEVLQRLSNTKESSLQPYCSSES